jgi:hypothetical protein
LDRPRIALGHHRLKGTAEGVHAMLEASRQVIGRGMTMRIHYEAPGEAVFTVFGRPPARTPAERSRVEPVAERVLGRPRFFIEHLWGQGGTARWSLVTDHVAALPRFLHTLQADCRRSGRQFRVVSLGPYAPPGAETPTLTRRQSEALLAAWDLGYYEGRAKVRDVAAALGMSASGLHGLLARAERQVIGAAAKQLARATPHPGGTLAHRGPRGPAAPPAPRRQRPAKGRAGDADRGGIPRTRPRRPPDR